MRGEKLFAALALVTAVGGCTPTPPPYESRYSPPVPAATPPPPLPAGSSFVDDFDRPDTPLGLGAGWDLRGAKDDNPVLPPATDGFISGGHYASLSGRDVYAVRNFRSTVRRVGAEALWTQVGEGVVETLVMAITANDNITSDLVQLAVHRSGWTVSTRRNGKFRHVMSGRFDPPLEFDRHYRFEMDAADGSVTVRVPEAEQTGKVGTIGLLSERAFWRHAFSPTDIRPVGAKSSVNMVWVAEEGRPLSRTPTSE